MRRRKKAELEYFYSEIKRIKKEITEIQRLLNRGKIEEAIRRLEEIRHLLFALTRTQRGDAKDYLELAWWWLCKAEDKLQEEMWKMNTKLELSCVSELRR